MTQLCVCDIICFAKDNVVKAKWTQARLDRTEKIKAVLVIKEYKGGCEMFYDYEVTTGKGEKLNLSEYKGKVVFLNFWATWCPPCRAEMPAIQEIFEESLEQEDKDLVILGVAFPGFGRETTEQGVRDFLQENGYTYPVVMDTGGTLIAPYYITAYPTTYMIDRDGNIYGYVTGSLSKENMEDIIAQTKNK